MIPLTLKKMLLCGQIGRQNNIGIVNIVLKLAPSLSVGCLIFKGDSMNNVSLFMKCIMGLTSFILCISIPFLVKRKILNTIYSTEYSLTPSLDSSCFDDSDWIENNTDNPRIFIMEPVTPEQVTDQDLEYAQENIKEWIVIRED